MKTSLTRPPVKFGSLEYFPNSKGTTDQKEWAEQFKTYSNFEGVKDSIKALEEIDYNFLVEQNADKDKDGFLILKGKTQYPLWQEKSDFRSPANAMFKLLGEALKDVIADLKGYKEMLTKCQNERRELKKQLEELKKQK